MPTRRLPSPPRAVARRLVALSGACHPAPTAAVTGLSTVLGAALGLCATRLVLLAAAVLTGQLSIGWSNDVLDASRDTRVGRSDKPLATGRLGRATVAAAAAGALSASVPLSLALGARPGTLHLLAVAGGWAYNLGVKRTVLSWLPYAVSFGLLPAFVVLAAGGTVPAWLVAAGAQLGVGAHLFNVLPDIAADAATGVRGLPVRIGPRVSRILGAALLAGAAGTLTLAPSGPPAAMAWAALSAACCLSAAAALAGRRARSRLPFLFAVAAAAVDVALLTGRASTML